MGIESHLIDYMNKIQLIDLIYKKSLNRLHEQIVT